MKNRIQENNQPFVQYAARNFAPVKTFSIHPIALQEHLVCPHYMDNTQTKFIHLRLTEENSFGPQKTETSMLFFLISGSCRVDTSERGDSMELQAGQMLFVTAGYYFKATGAPKGDCLLLRFNDFSFCENLTLQNLAQYVGNVRSEFEPYAIAPPLDMFLRNMVFYTDNHINCSHLQQIKQDECFILMRICYTKEVLARMFAPLLCNKDLELKMKIQRFAVKARTIAELAELCKMTEITMKRKIKSLFGLSAYRWMRDQRNHQILFDLRNGILPKEICFSYGYSSLSNFTAYCKRQFGMTPTQIRQLTQEEYTKLQQRIQDEPIL